MQVEGQHELTSVSLMATGARVSNTYLTWPILRDRLSKERLILDGIMLSHVSIIKDLSV